MTKRITIAICVALLLLSSIAAFGQGSTSTITGQVTDQSGAVVSGAKVEAKNEATGVVFSGTTNATGNYSFPSLTPGSYTVTVSQSGFQTFITSRNVLTVGQPLVVDIAMKVGAQSESVQVESSYERIETTNATISDVMDEKQVKNLPLNGRNPLSLLTLEPGVVQRTTNGAGSGTHVFGSRDRAHNVTIDGIDANESTVPNPQSNIQRLNPDNVQEFRTVTLGATAENGRNSGANVMIGTKSGGNAFHGDVFYFVRNRDFNANEWFANANNQPRNKLNLNQWGFDVSGPIVKNKTFFFGSYQGNDIRQSSSITSSFGIPLVLTPSMRNGIFRFVRGTVSANGVNFTQADKRMVDANGNLLPSIAVCTTALKANCVDTFQIGSTGDPKGVGLDPTMSGLIKALPSPNAYSSAGDGLNNAGYLWSPPTKFTGPNYYVRVDHTFDANNNVFVRWLQGRYDTKEGDFLNARPMVFPGYPPLGEVTRINKNLAASFRHTFSPSLVNELTAGFNRFAFAFTFGESNPAFGDPKGDPPYFDSCVYGSTTEVSAPYCVSPHTQRAVTTPQIIDNLSWIHGAHTIRAGINFRFYVHNDSRGFFGGTITAPGIIFSGSNRDPFVCSPNSSGVCQGIGWGGLPGAVTGVSGSTPSSVDLGNLKQALDELAGIPYSINQSYVADFASDKYLSTQYATVYTRAHQYDSYIQDEWKVRSNLTLNAGLRWELNPAPYDAKQTLVPNVFPDGSQGPVTWVKSDRWFKNNNYGSVGPRLGIAWSPDNKTSIRAGYAWLFDTISTFQVTAIAGKMPGFMQGCTTTVDSSGTVGTTSGCATPANVATTRIASGYPVSISAPIKTPSQLLTPAAQPAGLAPSLGALDPNLKNPSVHEWSLTIQRELPLRFVGEVGYIGKRGTHLQRAYDLNQGDVNNHPDFVASFNVARQNILNGCSADGTGCPAGITGVRPSVLLNLVTSAFLNSSTTRTELIRNNIGNTAARMDALSLTSTQRGSVSAFPLNYFRPNPQFSQMFFQDSGGDSYYHGLYASARRRFEQGVTFGFSYTFSKSIDDMSVDPTGASTGGGLSTTSFSRTPTDIHNFRLDRALSDFDNTHVLLGDMLLELPFGKGKKFLSGAPGWLNQIIGGWSTTGIFNYQSGEPYTLSSGVRTTNTTHTSTAVIVGPKFAGNSVIYNIPNVVGPVNYTTGGFIQTLNDPHLNCQQINNSQSYACIPAAGQNGVGRNSIRGPNYWNLDSGLLKNFTVTERFKLQFRAEMFNVLNHPNFENPRNSTGGSATVTSSAFGQTCCVTAAVASTANVNAIGEPMRVIQLGLKLSF